MRNSIPSVAEILQKSVGKLMRMMCNLCVPGIPNYDLEPKTGYYLCTPKMLMHEPLQF